MIKLTNEYDNEKFSVVVGHSIENENQKILLQTVYKREGRIIDVSKINSNETGIINPKEIHVHLNKENNSDKSDVQYLEHVDRNPKYLIGFKIITKIIAGEIPFYAWPFHAAWAWIEWLAQTPHEDHYLIAEHIIHKLDSEEKWKNNKNAIEVLAHNVSILFRKFYDNSSNIKATESPFVIDNCLALDNILAKILEDKIFSKEGSDAATFIRKQSSEFLKNYDPNTTEGIQAPYLLWIDERSPLKGAYTAHLVTRALWFDVVKPRLERQELFKSPVLPIGVIDKTLDAFNASSVELINNNYILRTSIGQDVGIIEISDIKKIQDRQKSRHQKTAGIIFSNDEILQKIEAAGSVAGQLLLRHLTWVGYRQNLEGKINPNRYEQIGGPTMLTKLLGLDSSQVSKVIDALDGFEMARIPVDGKGHVGLLGWDHWPARSGGRSKKGEGTGTAARAIIYLRDALMPGFVFDMPSDFQSQRDERRLSPMPRPDLQPALVGRPQTFAPQLALQLIILEHFTLNAEKYVEQNLALNIEGTDWRNLFEKAKVPWSCKDQILEAYSTGEGRKTGKPFLLQETGDHFKLAPEHQESIDQIKQTGEFYIGRAAGGKASARRKKKLNKNKQK